MRTAEQQIIHRHLLSHQGISALQIQQDLGDKIRLSLSTVHNELNELCEQGLAQEGFEVNEGYLWWAKRAGVRR